MEAQTVGRYQLRELLGAGAMGQVFRAHDPQLRRDVAIKIVQTDMASVVDSQRVQREALTWAQVVHPSVVQLLDSGITELKSGAYATYLVLELVRGETLEERLEREGPLPPDLAVEIAIAVAEGLAAAHAAGVLHRDLKPSNILLEGDRPRISDFGLAKLFRDKGQSLTASTDLVGTPAYMCPEQIRGETLGPAADVYALGAVLYAMLSGRPPFTIKLMAALFDRIVSQTPTPLIQLNPRVDATLNGVVERCLAKEPARRFPTAKALAGALRALPRGHAAPARVGAQRPLAWGAGGVILGVLLGAAVALGVTWSAREPDLHRDPRFLHLEDRLLRDDWEGAAEAARELLRVAPHDPQLHIYLGDALLNDEDKEAEAVEAYKAAVELDPTHPRALEGLAASYYHNLDYAQAKLVCERGLELYPEWSMFHYYLANTEGSLGDRPAQIRGLTRALELAPRDWLALNQRASAHLIAEDGALDETERDVLQALEIAGEDEAVLYDNLVEVARRRGDHQRAFHLCNLAQGAAYREANVENLMIRRVQVVLDVTKPQGDAIALQSALAEAEYIVQVFPKNGSAYGQYAGILARVNRLPDAIAACEKALELFKGKNPREAKVVEGNLQVFKEALERRRAQGDRTQ